MGCSCTGCGGWPHCHGGRGGGSGGLGSVLGPGSLGHGGTGTSPALAIQAAAATVYRASAATSASVWGTGIGPAGAVGGKVGLRSSSACGGGCPGARGLIPPGCRGSWEMLPRLAGGRRFGRGSGSRCRRGGSSTFKVGGTNCSGGCADAGLLLFRGPLTSGSRSNSKRSKSKSLRFSARVCLGCAPCYTALPPAPQATPTHPDPMAVPCTVHQRLCLHTTNPVA